jgi:PTS system cellobiose-specific IIB component
MKRLLICCLFGNTAITLAKKCRVWLTHIAIRFKLVGQEQTHLPVWRLPLIVFWSHRIFSIKEELKKAIKEGQHIEVIAGYPYAAIDAEKILKFAIDRMEELVE